MNQLYKKRVWANRISLALALCAMAIGMAFLAWILSVLVIRGIGGINLAVFTEMTPSPSGTGGLANAIFGSLMMVGFATFIATPIGILAGVYLAEFGNRGWVGPTTRFINDILLSAPSIVIGLVVYTVLVAPFGGYSALAGSVALGLLVIPIVVRTTEDMLLLVPNPLREAAAALGMPRSLVIQQVAYKAARAGMITGVENVPSAVTTVGVDCGGLFFHSV